MTLKSLCKLSMLFLLILYLVVGCATPRQFTTKPYDQISIGGAKYRIDEAEDGFIINMHYSRYQFFPESDAVAAAAKSELTSVAYEIAKIKGKKIKPINSQRIRVSMGRNGMTGITSCTLNAPVEYE